MITINRTAIVVMPGQPFLDWLHRADPTSVELSLEDLWREPTIYLLPECENEEAAREYLREIFEEQLNGWYRVPTAWPVRPDFPADARRDMNAAKHSCAPRIWCDRVFGRYAPPVRQTWLLVGKGIWLGAALRGHGAADCGVAGADRIADSY